MEILRFFTAGNVDDGKSTLIGRLLFDSNSVSSDVIEVLTKQSKSYGSNTNIDLALLTDGLRAEREQGITIDVAYKYFSTDKRKYIVADTPGHIQYTRNMFTGSSTADLAIILIDAKRGITDQTRRHITICSILNVNNIIVCINKMDAVNFQEPVFESIISEYESFYQKINLCRLSFIPVSALKGDNVVYSSQNMPWYSGMTLFETLETTEIKEVNERQMRFQVQYVIRAQSTENPHYRGYSGELLSGEISVGDEVTIYPNEYQTTIKSIESHGVSVTKANTGESIVLQLTDDLDVSRGAFFTFRNQNPSFENLISATICWMDDKEYSSGNNLLLQQGSFITKAIIKKINSKVDINNNNIIENQIDILLNDVCNVTIKTATPFAFDDYKTNVRTGSFILINENTNNTVAAGIILI